MLTLEPSCIVFIVITAMWSSIPAAPLSSILSSWSSSLATLSFIIIASIIIINMSWADNLLHHLTLSVTSYFPMMPLIMMTTVMVMMTTVERGETQLWVDHYIASSLLSPKLLLVVRIWSTRWRWGGGWWWFCQWWWWWWWWWCHLININGGCDGWSWKLVCLYLIFVMMKKGPQSYVAKSFLQLT